MKKGSSEKHMGVGKRAAGGWVTWRSVALGLLLTLLLAIVAPYNDFVRHSPLFIGNHLPVTVIVAITLLCVVVNPLLGRRRFTPAEMVTAIGMMLVACALPTSGLFRYFTPQLAATVYNSNSFSWAPEYLKYLPDWMLPSTNPNSPIIQSFFLKMDPVKGPTLDETWGPWMTPYLAWGLFLGPLFLCLTLVCALLRKQWVQRERLAFPMAMIPMEMMQEPEAGRRWSALWRNPLLWIAAAIPFAIHLLNGAHLFWPNLPQMSLGFDFRQTTMADYPWNLLPTYVRTNSVSFSIIAVTFFVPLEVAFSIWVFYLFYNLYVVVAAVNGVQVMDEHRWAHSAGLWMAYGVMLLWLSRHHLLYVAKSVWRWEGREPEEPLSYRTCVIGIGLSAATAIGFLMAAGMTWWLAIGCFATLVLWSLILTRIVMEAGVLLVAAPTDPLYLWTWLVPGVTAGAQKIIWMRNWMIAALSIRGAFADAREQLMPYVADTLRMQEAVAPAHRRRHFMYLLAALALCALVSGATHHILSYTYGRGTFDANSSKYFPEKTLNTAHEAAEPDVKPPRFNRGLHVAGGAAAMLIVSSLRVVTTAMPLHPIGLLLLNTYAGDRLWFSVMLGWAIKIVIMRWGGVRVYQAARPVFIGLLVGESLVAVFWSIMGLMVNWPLGRGYEVLPT